LGYLVHTQLYSPSKAATIKKTKKKKPNKPLQDKSNTNKTTQFNTRPDIQHTVDKIIGYGELAQKIRFSITYADRLWVMSRS